MTQQLQSVIAIAKQAGEILNKYHHQDLDVRYKLNQFDPVTQADKEADALIRAELARHFPQDAILSEEHEAQPESYDGRVWMVDPLDGTKDFVAGRDCFSTMIGLCENGKPVLGVVYAPARGVLYYAESGAGAFIDAGGSPRRLRVSDIRELNQATRVTRFVQKGDVRPLEALVGKLPFSKELPEGSIGLKVARIAAGEAEVFVHCARSSKWDALAADIILAEAGGIMTDIDGNALDYRKSTLNWDRYLLATNTPVLHEQLVRALHGFRE